jgi:RNA polymerase sigma-70 factor, ECF subfamily
LLIPRVSPLDPDSPDTVLVAASRQGNSDALELLLGRHYDRMHRLCRRMLGNDRDAEDATQEAMVAIVRGLPSFDGRSAFSTWAYRVATNSALDELRRRRRRPTPTPIERDGGEPSSAGGCMPSAGGDSWPDPGDAISARLEVDAALQQLPADQRSAVVLRDLLDLDYAEIAEVLSIPIGTVRSRIARGRSAIASLLAHEHGPAGPPTREVARPPRSEKGNSASVPERQREQER